MAEEKKIVIRDACLEYSMARNRLSNQESQWRSDPQSRKASYDILEQQFKDALAKSLDARMCKAVMDYEGTLIYRHWVDVIATRMKAAGCELSDGKIEQLIHVFEDNIFRESPASEHPLSQMESKPEWYDDKDGVAMREFAAILSPQEMKIFKQCCADLIRF